MKLKNTFSKKIYLVAIIVVAILLYYLLKNSASNFGFYQYIIKTYAWSVGYGFECLANCLGYNVIYDHTSGQIHYGAISFGLNNKLAIKFFVLIIPILFIHPRKILKTLIIMLVAWAGLYIISVLRFFIDITNSESTYYLYAPMIYTARYLIVLGTVYYKINLHTKAKNYLAKIDAFIIKRFQFRTIPLIIVILLSFVMMGIIDWYLIVQSRGFINFLSEWILLYSKFTLQIIGYQPIIVGHGIFIESNWVHLGTPCLGVGLMALYSLLIGIFRSDWINKVIYIFLGINILIFANAIRINAILLHIYHQQLPPELIEDYHGKSNIFFYITVLIMLIIYTRWFANINFRLQKNTNI